MIEPRAIVQSEMSGEDGAELFYANLLNPLPVGTKLTTVADVLAALREPSEAMIDRGGRGIAFNMQHFGGAMTLARYSSYDLEEYNRKSAEHAYRAMIAAKLQSLEGGNES